MTAAISSKTIEPSAELPDYKLIAKKKAIPHSKVQLPAISIISLLIAPTGYFFLPTSRYSLLAV